MGDSTLENRFNSQDMMTGQNSAVQDNFSVLDDFLSQYDDVKSAYRIAKRELKENCSESMRFSRAC